MVRDFSEKAKDTLYEQIDSVTPQNMMEGVADFFGDLDYHIRGWLGELSIENYVNNVDEYHRFILDENDTTKEQIDTIFANVSAVEHTYAGKLQILHEQLVQNTSYFEKLSQMIAPERIIFLESASVSLRESIGNRADFILTMLLLGHEVLVDEEMRVLLEQKLDDMTENRYGGKSDISQMSEEEIKKLVCLYDFLYPDTAKKMDDVLASGENNTLTDADKNKIKYIAYTAPEPYRSVYLGYVDSYEVGSFGGEDCSKKAIKGAYYKRKCDHLYFVDTVGAFAEDARGPYTTWFHESGHATDSNAMDCESFYCLNYKVYNEEMGMEVNLRDAIYYDVYCDIEKTVQNIREVTDIEGEVDEQKIVNSFKFGNDISELNDDEMKIRKAVVAWYDVELAGEEAEAANDIYGGVTNLEIGEKYGYGHRGVNDIGEYNYWYDSEGNETGAQSKELFAEYFSYYMTGDELAITSMREHFPQACQVLDKMINSMEETIAEGKD